MVLALIAPKQLDLGVLTMQEQLVARNWNHGRPAADLVPCRRFTACRGFDGLDQLKRRQVSQAMLALADGNRAAFDTVYDAVWPVAAAIPGRCDS